MNNGVSCPYELPKGWVWTRLGEIVRAVEKVSPRTAPDEGFTYVDIASIVSQRIADPKRYFGREAPSRARQLVKSGDVLFSTVRTYLKHIAIVDERYSGQIASTGFCVIRPWPCIDSKLVFYLVQTDTFVNPLTQRQRGTSYPAVRDSDVLMQPVAVPPLAEQHRIVAKIEELFTRLDAGVEALTRIKAQLKRYRQAVLKHAYEGKLTAEWRKAHQHELEPASVLLERIKQKRHQTAKGTYKELPQPDASGLPELPEGWVWTRIGDISEAIQYGYTASSTPEPVGPKMLRITDIQNNSVKWDALPHCRIETEEKAKYLLKEGDLVFARTGATVGKSFLITDTTPESVFASYLIRIVLSPQVNKTFVHSFFRSQDYWTQVYAGQLGIGQPNVNSRTLSRLRLPLCSALEQQRIAEGIERRFSVADQIEKTVDQGLKQAERLRQSILKKAFEGKLVAQYPNDEPAEILLERIREERARAQVGAKSKKVDRKETPDRK